MHTFRALLRKLRKFRFHYEPLIEIRVSKDAIVHNLKTFQKISLVAPVLKSNAYGHGLVQLARIVDKEDIPFTCVDSYFEALILRNEGIRSPLLIIGYTPSKNILGSRLPDTAFGIIGMEELRELSQRAKNPVVIHLKLDTGMHRHGIALDEIDEALQLIRANQNIMLAGIYSHLADADTANSEHAASQLRTWNDLVPRFRREFPSTRYFHVAATSGIFYADKLDANILRLGIGLYGINVSLATLNLKPALEMVTRITSVRELKEGESVGYNATFTAPKGMRIATIPTGYLEGVDRRLSNKGTVLVRGAACAIVGRVSMNITSFDISHLPDVRVGEPVTVISRDPSNQNSVENIARECGTIPYDILVRIPAHLRRVVA